MRQIFLDTETTGLYPDQGDRLIEIGCVELVNRKLTGNNKHFYVNPGRDSHEEALKVHGITTEFLSDKPAFEAIVDEFLAYVAGAEIVIHNAPFDLGFLNKELALSGRKAFKTHVCQVVDSLAMAKEIYPGKRNGLDALCDRLGVDRSGRTLHGGLLDAELLADVFINLTRGQDALVMESFQANSADTSAVRVDFSALDLPVLVANESECSAHETVLKEIDKASGGKTILRLAVA
jgi:DNA polymerase-3 subunit epsilon